MIHSGIRNYCNMSTTIKMACIRGIFRKAQVCYWQCPWSCVTQYRMLRILDKSVEVSNKHQQSGFWRNIKDLHMNVTIVNISQQNEQVRRHTYSQTTVCIRYNGNLCEYKTITLNMLILHLKTSHEGVQYYCNQFVYHTTNQQKVKLHRNYRHEDSLNNS